jgi:hypothetical protein
MTIPSTNTLYHYCTVRHTLTTLYPQHLGNPTRHDTGVAPQDRPTAFVTLALRLSCTLLSDLPVRII